MKFYRLHNTEVRISFDFALNFFMHTTYPHYSDSNSRDAVEAVGMELVRRDKLRGTEEGAQDEVRLSVAE